jgi:hypothetical protein
MKRRLIFATAALVVALAIPGVAVATPAATTFTGTWVSTDYDGSTQLLIVSGGSRPSVVYQDFYASGCDTFAGPATHWVAAGTGSVEDDFLFIEYHKSGCGTFLQGGYGDFYVYDSGSDTLEDSVGIIWTRAT